MLKRNIVWCTPFVVLACASGNPSDDELVGEARLAITQVPADVRCASVTVQGNRTVQKSFDLTPGQASVLSMTQLPVGAVTLSASAYDAACSAVTGASVPTWVATPAAASLSSSAVTDVTLTLQRNGRANVNLDFNDGPSCGANGVSCAAASDCCSAFCTAGVCAPSGSTANCSPASGAAAAHLTQLFTVTQPLGLESAPGDSNNVYVVERTGRIRVGATTNPPPGVFLDITSSVLSTGGEQGLLGLAFHPNYAANGRFFVTYNGANGNLVVAEYHRSVANPLVADSAGTVLLSVPKPAANHNAGQLEFGSDGFLYIAIGDGGGANDAAGNAQSLNSLLGKVLRIDVSTTPYTSPPGNMPGGKPEIWDSGLRNPWRFSFDACTGDLYISDVGQSLTEEINVEPAHTGKRNYGWATVEGTTCAVAGCNTMGLTMPTYTYATGVNGNCAVIGGFVYRGSKIPGLRGRYVYGDYCSGRVWSVAPGGMPIELIATNPSLQLASFGEDSAHELYALAQAGGVYRLDP